jgi:hypothetical protein
MSDQAFLTERSAPSAHRAAERRNTVAPRGTEQRNDSGTLSLKALADKVLSRGHTGTPSGTPAERTPVLPFRGGRNAPDENGMQRNAPCPHVTDPELAAWYAENPKLTCARCWVARHGMPIQADDTAAQERR